MNKSDKTRNYYMLKNKLSKKGYDWWWHSLTGRNERTGEEKPFFIEYFVINPALGGNKVIYGQLPENKKNHIYPSYVMIKVGTWGKNPKQLNAFYPISDLKIEENSMNLSIRDCSLSETHMCGKVSITKDDSINHPEYMSDYGEMSWDLDIDKKISFNVGYGASKFFRTLNAFEMFWHAEGMKTQYSGTIILDGEKYIINKENSYGYADKNWGCDFTSPWVWISSCNLKSNQSGKVLSNSVFDVGGGRPKVFGIPINRKLLIDLNYNGMDYEFNFSKFWTNTKTIFDCYETNSQIIWNIRTENFSEAMDLECYCNKDEMLLVNYEAPNGEKKHNKLWNGGTGYGNIKLYTKDFGKRIMLDDISFTNAGCEYGVYGN